MTETEPTVLATFPDPVYIWVVGDEPDTGSLHAYAQAWARWRSGQGPRPSETVLTWDDTSDPVTWNVDVTLAIIWGDGRRRYRIAVPGLSSEVYVLVREPDAD